MRSASPHGNSPHDGISIVRRLRTTSRAVAAALLLFAAPVSAQSIGSLFTSLPADFAHLFTPANGIIAGAGAAASLAARPSDRAIERRVFQASGGRHDFFHPGAILGDGTTQGVIALGTYIAGRAAHRPRLGALGADLVDAQIVNGIITQALKSAIDRARPTGSKHSFPSGHTSATFATAAVIQDHYGWKAAVPLYALGGYVSASRLVDNQHWASDVLFGAALGIVSGRAASVGTGSHRVVVSPVVLPGGFGIAGTVGRTGRPEVGPSFMPRR